MRRCHPLLVAELLASDPGLAEARDDRDISVLRIAHQVGCRPVIDLLLDAEPLVDIFDAAACGAEGLVGTLLDEDPDVVGEFSPDGFTALHIACYFGHLPVVQTLLTRGADPEVPSRNGLAVRPLNSAISSHQMAVIHLLLDRGADVDGRMAGGFAPLHAAAHQGRLEMAEALLLRGADPAATTVDGRTPLDVADGHPLIIQLLDG